MPQIPIQRDRQNTQQASVRRDPARRIVLTGFMGSGKSTCGPLLAQRLGWRFLDADAVIEAAIDMPISHYFSQHGEAAFRLMEHETIARLLQEESLVLALGGGAIEHEETRALLLTSACTRLVHLEVLLTTTLARCQGTESLRPILADSANLAARYQRRLPLYRIAPINLAVDTLTPDQTVDAILNAAK